MHINNIHTCLNLDCSFVQNVILSLYLKVVNNFSYSSDKSVSTVCPLWNSVPGSQESKFSTLKSGQCFDALGQAVLVYGMGVVPSATEKKRGEKHERWVYWVMQEHKAGSRTCEASGAMRVSASHPQIILFPPPLPSMFIITVCCTPMPPYPSHIFHRFLLQKKNNLSCVFHKERCRWLSN